MPIIQSAKKALRQSRKRRARNIKRKEAIKNAIQKARLLITKGKTSEAQKLLPEIYRVIDKAKKHAVIKANTAARKKSRLTLLINKALKA